MSNSGPAAGITIREARPGAEDVGLLLAMEQRAFGDKSFTIWAVEPFCRRGCSFLFEYAERTIGHALLMREWTDPASAYLASFSIDDEFQGKGFGRRALRLLLSDLRRRCVSRVTLTVEPGNEAACRLYQSEGFRIVETIKDQYGPGEDRYSMAVVVGL